METEDGRRKNDIGRVKMGESEEGGEGALPPIPPTVQPSLQQLMEEIETQQLTIEALQHENSRLKGEHQQQLTAQADRRAVEQCKRKIHEYKSAVEQRDELIKQLQGRLAECLQQQEDQNTDSLQQMERLTREVNILKAQLKETTDTISSNTWLTGVNPREHLQLKNKLIAVQQDRGEDKQLLEQLTEQLDHKAQQYLHLEKHYQQYQNQAKADLKQASAEIDQTRRELEQAKRELERREAKLETCRAEMERLEAETMALQETTETIKGTYSADLRRVEGWLEEERRQLTEKNGQLEQEWKRLTEINGQLEKERKRLTEKNGQLEEEARVLGDRLRLAESETERRLSELTQREQEAKEKAASEVQILMQQAQVASTALYESQKEQEVQQAAAEERFGQQLTMIKHQMSELHQEELAKVKRETQKLEEEMAKQSENHKEELARVTESVAKANENHEQKAARTREDELARVSENHQKELVGLREEMAKTRVEELAKVNENHQREMVGLKDEMAKARVEDLAKVRETHKQEVLSVMQQIEALEHTQKEDHANLILNLNSQNDLNLQLKTQLDAEKEKGRRKEELLAVEVQGGRERERQLNGKIKAEVDAKNEAEKRITDMARRGEEMEAKMNEFEAKSKETESKLKETERKQEEAEGLISSLRATMEQLSEGLETVTKEKSHLQSKLVTEEQKVGEIVAEKSSLDIKIGELNSHLEALNSELAQSRTGKDELSRQVQALSSELTQSKAEKDELNEELNRQVQILSSELIQSKAEKDELNVGLNRKVQTLSSELIQSKTEKDELNAKLKEREEMYNHVAQELEANKQILRELDEECMNLKREKGFLLHEQETLQGETEKLKHEIKILNDTKITLTSEKGQLDGLKKELEEKNNRLTTENGILVKEKENLTTEMGKLVKANENLIAEKGRLAKEKEDLSSELTQCSGVLEREIEKLGEEARTKIDMEKQVFILTKEVRERNEEITMYKEQCISLSDSLAQKCSELTVLEETVKSTMKKLGESEDKLKELEKKLSESENKRKNLDKNLEEAKMKIKEFEEQHRQATEAQKEMESLREKYVALFKQCGEEEERRHVAEEECQRKCQDLNNTLGHLDSLVANAYASFSGGKFGNLASVVADASKNVAGPTENLSNSTKNLSGSSHEASEHTVTLEKNLRKVISKLQQTEENTRLLEQAIERVGLEKGQLEESLSKAGDENEGLRVEISQLRTLTEGSAERESLANEVSQLKNVCTVMETQKREGEEERNRLLVEKQMMTDDITQEKMEREKIEKQMKNLMNEKEAVSRELVEAQKAFDNIEQKKNEVETERDKLVEEYKMVKIAMDRQAVLPTHPELTSQPGISVEAPDVNVSQSEMQKASITASSESQSKETLEQQTKTVTEANAQPHAVDSQQKLPVNVQMSESPKGEKLISITHRGTCILKSKEDLTIQADVIIDGKNLLQNEMKGVNEQITQLEKEKQKLSIAVKQLKAKSHNQHFTIKSLENEKSRLKRRVVEMESEKETLRAEQERLNQDRKEKVDLQRQLNELSVSLHLTEESLKHHRQKLSHSHLTLRSILQGSRSPVDHKLKELVMSIESIISPLESDQSPDPNEHLRDRASSFSDELDSMCEDHKLSLNQLLQSQEEVDQLRAEKLSTELENIALVVELERLRDGNMSELILEKGTDEEVDERDTSRVRSTSDITLQEVAVENKSGSSSISYGKSTDVKLSIPQTVGGNSISTVSTGVCVELSQSTGSEVNVKINAPVTNITKENEAKNTVGIKLAESLKITEEIRNSGSSKTMEENWNTSSSKITDERRKTGIEDTVFRLEAENERLRGQLEREDTASRLEKLHLRSPKLREYSEGVWEKEAAVGAGVWVMLEKLATQWETHQDTSPSLSHFILTQAAKVRDVAEKVSGGDGGAWDGRHCVEVALRLLHQAVVRGVCDDYRGVVRKTVAALDDHITNTVRHITIPSTTLPPIITALPSITAIPTNATPKLAVPKHYNTICFDTSQLDTTCSEGNQTRAFSPDAPLSDSTGTGQNPQRGFDICDTTAPDSEVLDISATVVVMKEDLRHWENQVTRLIDVRTTLVEAATEFEAELECAVRDRIAIIRQEVERVIEEVTGHPMRDSTNIPPVDNQASSSIQSQHQDGSSTAVTPLSPQDTLPATKEDRRTTLSLQDKDKTGEETVGDAETEPQVTDARKDENEANSSEGQGTKTREADGPRISNDRQEPTSPTSPRDTILSASPQDTSCPTLPRDTDGLTDTQKQFVEEFLKLSSRIHREAEAEKLEMLVKQKTVVHNILEDNKTKLHTLCSEYVSRITTVTSLTDAVWCVKELAGALEERLSAEANWVQGKYEELVQQYTREQSTRYTTHTRTTQALAGSLTRLLHQPVHQCCDVGDSGSSKHSGEVRRLEGETEVRRLEGETERLEGEVRHLQAQLEARDNHDLESLDGEVARLRAQVDHDLGIRSRLSCDLTSQLQHLKVQVTQRHLQGLYHDRDWYKRLVGLLSQITLQLLHYYTVAQTLTQPTRPSTAHSHSQPPMSLTSHSQLNSLTAFSLTKPVPIAPLTALSPTLDHPSHPESTTSRQHDGSFLSEDGGDGWGEGGHYTSFTDDEAATTGLMGAAGREGPPEQLEAPDTGSGSGEGGSTCGSGLDSTGLSEGLLEDLDKDRQLRPLLSRICPHLLSVLSGRWERVDLPALEKETQELAISLQAAAGMVNIYIHSARASDVSSHTLTDTTPEKEIIQEVEKERDGKEEALTENQNIWEEKAQAEEQNKQAPDSQDQLAQEDSITMPDFAKFDLNDLTQSIRDLLNQGGQKIDKHQTLEDLDFTRLRERDPTSPDRLRRALSQPGAREDLQVYLHHLLGRLEGMKEQQMAIEEENKKLLHNNRTLAGQLQVAQDQLEELEGSDGGGGGVGRGGGVTGAASHHHYAAKMEASKDLRERVRSMLSAKKKSTMCREELIERVGELEGLVAAVISEADASINRLKTQLDDLTQQLETADRQLRSSRQFLEQQASERDQEAEELEGRISRLSAQLRDKDTQLVAHTGLVKEVESLERQLRDMRRELASVQASREASLADTKAAQDKIRDLREIIQTLESQVDRRGVAEVELRGRVTDLQTALSNAHTQAHTLSAELEELRYTRSEERLLHPDSISGRTRDSEEDEEEEEDQGEEGGGQPTTTTTTTTTTSIFNELQEETDLTLLEMIEERLDRTTRDLETVQASSPTPLSPPSTARDVTESNVSDDDISEVCVRALSPSALHTRLEGLLTRLGRVVHTAIRHITHTQAAYTDLKFNHQEVVSERDAAETRWREQVGAVSGLEAKVEELRHAHPTTHTTHLNARLVTTRKQLDHTNAQLTTKAREVEELRYTLGTTRDQLKTREVELDRLHSLTPSHSLPDTATTTQQLLDTVKQLQSDVTHKNDRIEQLETELSGVCVDGAIPPSLADSLVAGKNAELSELTQRLSTLTTGVLAALSHLRQSDVPRASLTLKQLLGSGVGTCGEGSSSSGDMTRSPEILRKSAPDNNNTTLLSQPATVKGGGIVSSPVPRGGSHEDHHATVDSSQPSSTDLTLISPHREPHLSLSKVSQVTEESHEGRSRPGTPHHVNNTTTTIKTRLEGDFHEAQRLLEERGAELEALTGEVEDQLAPSPPPQHLIRACTTLQQQNAVLQDKLAEVEGRNHERDLEVDGLREEGEEWRAERKLWVEERRKAAEELHKLMEERVNWIVDREKLLEEVKDQQKTKDQLRKLSDEMGKLIFEREKHLEESKEQRKLTEELRKLVDESGKWSAERGKLLEEAERHGKRIKQLEREVEEVRKVGRELRKEGERLHGVLKERERQVEELMADLRRRETELQELKMREGVGDTDVGRETRQLHQRYNQEITALKDQHIVREKQLCSDYEERMATQVGEVSRRLAREHETAVCRQRDAYQAALLQQQQQHPSGHHKHTQTGQEAHTGHDAHHPPSPTQQATSDLCASVDAAVARVRQQLEVSGRLDESLARLVGRRSNGDDDTRASSVASDGGGGGDSTGVEVASHIQRLMAKVHQQGIEMLTLVELVYLQQHRGQLDSTQRSLLPFSPLPPRSASVTLSSPGPRERMQLTSHVARLEQELAASEQSTRTKLEALEWRVEQEQMSGREWQLSYEGERRRAREAEEQLRREKLNAADQAGELTRLRSQLFLAHLEMQKAQDEVKALSESIESRVRQGEGLQMSLDEERSNFSRVSRVLSHHRRHTAKIQAQQEAHVKDLCSSLETEREKILHLYGQLKESDSPPTSHATALTDLQMKLVVEKERRREAEAAFERERVRAATEREESRAEQGRVRVQLGEEQDRVTQLTRTARTNETHRQDLLRKLREERERVQQLESRVRECECEVRRLEGEVRTQSEVHREAAQRLRQEAHTLHIAHTRALNKLGEAEAEVCRVRQEASEALREAEVGSKREGQLRQELTTERTANERHGLPALARLKSVDEFVGVQLQENLELCKSVLRLTDQRQEAQVRIHSLEDTIDQLNSQLRQAHRTSQSGEMGNVDEAARERESEAVRWETERTSLLRMAELRESELTRLRAQVRVLHNPTTTTSTGLAVDEERLQYLYGRYLTAEHRVKALTWQKRYLLVVLRGYTTTETHTLARLHSMAAPYLPNTPHRTLPEQTPPTPPLRPRYTFRVVAVGVVAVVRMRGLVERYKRKKRLGWRVMFSDSDQRRTNTRSPLPSIITPTPENSRPGSSSSGLLNVRVSDRTVGGMTIAVESGRRSVEGYAYGITSPTVERTYVGVTSPTAEGTYRRPMSPSIERPSRPDYIRLSRRTEGSVNIGGRTRSLEGSLDMDGRTRGLEGAVDIGGTRIASGVYGAVGGTSRRTQWSSSEALHHVGTTGTSMGSPGRVYAGASGGAVGGTGIPDDTEIHRREGVRLRDRAHGGAIGGTELHGRSGVHGGAISRWSTGTLPRELAQPTTPREIREGGGGRGSVSFTGQTPPTKEPTSPGSHITTTRTESRSHRSLFPESKSRNWNEYIERVDNINTTLGFYPKQT